jgi:hypothetical protein
MEKDLQKAVTDRLVAGIDKSFDPCPLVGPKWFKTHPKGNPADYTFDTRKLAKAMGMKSEFVAKIVLKHTDFTGLGVEVKINSQGVIHVNFPASGAQPSK